MGLYKRVGMRYDIHGASKYIVESINIVDYLLNYEGLSFKKYGRNLRTNCPLHDDSTPSFSITVGKNVWYCFGCSDGGTGGSLINFLEKRYGITRIEAIYQIFENTGVNIDQFVIADGVDDSNILDAAMKFFISQKKKSECSFCDYFVKKQYDIDEIINNCSDVGYCPKYSDLENFLLTKYNNQLVWLYGFSELQFDNAIVFPVRDIYGFITHFRCRKLDGDIKTVATTEEAISCVPYAYVGLNTLKSQLPTILVEGDSDRLALSISKYKNKYNILGMGGLKINDSMLDLLKTYDISYLYIWVDGDRAGWNFLSNMIDKYHTLYEERGITAHAVIIDGVDPDECILQGSNLDNIIETSVPIPIWYINNKIDNIDGVIDIHHVIKDIVKISSDYSDLMKSTICKYVAKKTNYGVEVIEDQYLRSSYITNFDYNLEKMIMSNILINLKLISIYSIRPEYFYTKTARSILSKIINNNLNSANIMSECESYELEYLSSLDKIIDNGTTIKEKMTALIDYYKKRSIKSIAKQILSSNSSYDDGIQNINNLLVDHLKNNSREEIDIIDSMKSIIDNIISKEVSFGLDLGPGWNRTNAILQGLQPKLIMLMGNTGHGKTNIILNWIHNLSIINSAKVAIVSGEMDAQEITKRLISIYTGINNSNLNINNVTDEEMDRIFELITKIEQDRIFISTQMNFSEVVNHIRYMKIKYDIDYAVIDYMQLLEPASYMKNMNKTEKLKEMARKLKVDIVEGLNIPLIVVGQLSDDAMDDPIPTIRRSSESKLMTQDADVGIAMRKKNKKEKDLEPKGDILFHIDKVRYNVDKQLLYVDFDTNSLKIREA
jgi:replicative DNA helicase